MGVCFETDPVAALNQGLVPACANQFNAAELAIRGTVAYQAGSVTYDFNGEASSSYSYTATCAASLFDYSSMDSATCTEIQTANRRYGNPETETNCSYSNSTCNCSSMRIQKTQSTNTYVLLTEGAVQESDGSDYEICVTGNRMSQREMAFGNAYSITQLQKL